MLKNTKVINKKLSKIEQKLFGEYEQAEQDYERQKLLDEWDQICF